MNWPSPIVGLPGSTRWPSVSNTAISKVGTCGTCGSKQSWLPWCIMPIGTIQQSNNMNTQCTVLTKNSVVVASSLTGNEDGTPSKTSWVQVWKSHFCWVSVGVFECTRSSSCGRSGLCAVLLITGLCFQLQLKTSLWQKLHNSVKTNYLRTCAIISECISGNLVIKISLGSQIIM